MNKPWYKKWWGILLIAVLTLFFIILAAFGFYVYHIIKSMDNSGLPAPRASIKYAALDRQTREKIEGDGNYWIGSANPEVTIVEFSDFACPYCRKAFPKMREIGLRYKNNVKIIFRDMPMQESSLSLAMAGRCAGEQGLFWLMHDKLFQNQGVGGADNLVEMARQIGADTVRFADCLNSQKYIKQIQKDFSDGEELGVKGTPTWFINGVKIEGDIPYSVFIQIIESI